MMNYFRMKYEQFLMRMFDKVCALLSKTRSDWYSKHVLGINELEQKVSDLEQELDWTKTSLEVSYHIRDNYEDYIESVLKEKGLV